MLRAKSTIHIAWFCLGVDCSEAVGIMMRRDVTGKVYEQGRLVVAAYCDPESSYEQRLDSN